MPIDRETTLEFLFACRWRNTNKGEEAEMQITRGELRKWVGMKTTEYKSRELGKRSETG